MNKDSPNQNLIYGVLLIGVLAASSAAILIRAAHNTEANNPMFLLLVAAGRLAVASCVVAPIAAMGLHRNPPQKKHLYLAMAAGFALAIHFATWILSLAYTSVAASSAIVTSNPVWVSVLAWLFLKEKPNKKLLIGVGITLLGGIVIALADSRSNTHNNTALLGDGLALLGAISVSAYFLLGRAAQGTSFNPGLNLSNYVGIAYSTGAILLLPLPLLFGVAYTGHAPTAYFFIVLLGLVPQLIGHTSFNFAMKHLSPTLVTTVILLEPVFSSIAAILFFKEYPKGFTIVGAIVLLLGVLATLWSAKNAELTNNENLL